MAQRGQSVDSGVGEEVVADYIIEKLIASRRCQVGGKQCKEYLVKFTNYDSSTNEWIPADDIDKGLVDEYESKARQDLIKRMRENLMMIRNQEDKEKYQPKLKKRRKLLPQIPVEYENPFKYKIADYIYHAKKTEQGIIYFIKWKIGGIEKLPSAIVCKEIPELVIKFYEQVSWSK